MTETAITPATAKEAHIRIEDFSLPASLTEHTSLTALHITSDIPLDSYHSTLTQPFTIPPLPASITSLTLELFTFGYPPTFLSTLASALPNLRSLTLYSQLLAGTTAESFHDAIALLSHPPLLSLHAVDVFLPADFLTTLGAAKKPWRTLEFSWAFHEEDPGFHDSLAAPIRGIASLLQPGLVALTVAMTVPDGKTGLMPCPAATATPLLDALEALAPEDRTSLVALDLSAIAITVATWARLVTLCPSIVVESLAIIHDGAPETKTTAVTALAAMKPLQRLDVVVVSGMKFYSALRQQPTAVLESALLTSDDIKALGEHLPALEIVEVSILKVPQLGGASWKRVDGEWVGGHRFGPELSETEKRRIEEREKELGA
ncbi:hypothetical protein EDC01DRAFT_478979 [Geopyxis carbonaria]|nr:hypothetical protein EDC01DRAFT_478979 [Geopyxis carbonaria]